MSDESRPRIELLSDTVIDQIAAGEVIERPVAVVKELVENSMDAGATQIEVEYREGGKAFIRVEDNGLGMTSDEVRIALKRHATSKLKKTDDLLEMHTYGFRGEALPSIASVSRFLIRSRTRGSEEGFEMLVVGGDVKYQRACGCPVGTRIEVSQLFNSVPARRKFLKTDMTEANRIIQMVRQLALSQPSIGFRFFEGKRPIFLSPPCAGLRERLAEVYGKSLVRELLEVSSEAEHLRLRGWIGKPGFGRSHRNEIVIMVNGRPVETRLLNYAITEAYHPFLPRGKYPATFLNLEVPRSWVDVNVHPTKREVRFRDEPLIRHFIIEAITEVLRKGPLPEEDPFIRSERIEGFPVSPVESGQSSVTKGSPGTQTTESTSIKPGSAQQAEVGAEPLKPISFSAGSAESVPERGSPQVSPWEFLGTVGKEFGVYSLPRGSLLLVNRRAVLQRMLFSKLEEWLDGKELSSQVLLDPPRVEVEPQAEALMEDIIPVLAKLGISLEPFGRGYFRLTAIPAWMPESAGVDLVEDLIQRLNEERHIPGPLELLRRHLGFWIVRQAPLVIGQGVDFWQTLPLKLLACKTPHVSPQGRPTYIEISKNEMIRRFSIED